VVLFLPCAGDRLKQCSRQWIRRSSTERSSFVAGWLLHAGLECVCMFCALMGCCSNTVNLCVFCSESCYDFRSVMDNT